MPRALKALQILQHSAGPLAYTALLGTWAVNGVPLNRAAITPLLMGFTLVYFAEHYVVDILAGWLYAAAAFATVEWWVRRRTSRKLDVNLVAPQGPGHTCVAAD